ncbi:MAG: rhomboid family intramembrane serine protease [Lentisphaeria bacterium]|nr:rhomboid family intramembrane serine protease [Lentisphaeria bacterium]
MSLFDRDYIRQENPEGRNFFSDGNNMLWLLIAVNVLLFILNIRYPLYSFDIKPAAIIGSIFSHASFGHLFFNMFSLYIFGSLIARRTGGWKFLGLYLAGGIIGNLVFMACFAGEQYGLLGASGAVFGIMMTTAMLDPDRRFVLIFMPFFPIKTKTLIVAFTIIEVVSQLGNPNSGTAHLAHLGGFLGGYLFTLAFLKKQILWNPLKRKNTPNAPHKAPNVTFKVVNPQFQNTPVSQKELDFLLDKISQHGINSLSEQELARLKQAREQMQKGN